MRTKEPSPPSPFARARPLTPHSISHSDLTVSSAGGYLLQMLPGATEDTVEKLEQSVSSCPPVSEMMEARMTQREVAESLCGDLGLELVFQKTLGYG